MAIIFNANHRKVVDALQDLVAAEFTGTPVLYEKPETFRHRSTQFFSLIPGESSVLERYAGGSLREYEVFIRYYLKKPRLDNFKSNIFDFMSNIGERLIRLINNNNKYEDSRQSFSELTDTFQTITDPFVSIITYRWHNGRIETIDYDPSRTDREDKRDLQIFEASFLCNVQENT